MKCYNLHIAFEPSWETYNIVTRILGVKPALDKSEFEGSNQPSTWYFQLIEEDEDTPIDFINVFLDLLEPNFDELATHGINRDDIIFWLNYEYFFQCAMEYHPREMERLGKSGISLNIDCFSVVKSQ